MLTALDILWALFTVCAWALAVMSYYDPKSEPSTMDAVLWWTLTIAIPGIVFVGDYLLAFAYTGWWLAITFQFKALEEPAPGLPLSAATERPGGRPFWIDEECWSCGAELVYHDPNKCEMCEDDEPWYDEFWCPSCRAGIHMDWPDETQTPPPLPKSQY